MVSTAIRVFPCCNQSIGLAFKHKFDVINNTNIHIIDAIQNMQNNVTICVHKYVILHRRAIWKWHFENIFQSHNKPRLVVAYCRC